MSDYQDRGIIKWLPFDGLVGFHNLLLDLKHRLGQTPKPVLSEDKLEQMNRCIKEAVESGSEISIRYYQDGYFLDVVGHIIKIDALKRILILDDLKQYKFDDITSLDFFNETT